MVASKQATVTERRALLTDREREIIAGDADVEDSYRYQTISRVRARFDRLKGDLEAFEKHGDLGDEFRDIVCRAEGDRRDATEADEAHVEDRSGGPPGPTADAPDEPPVGASDDDLATVEFPGGRDREACEAAVYAARDYLEEHGSASMRELVTEVMPDHPLGYDVNGALEKVESGDRYRGSWWRRVVKPGLNALPDVAAPAGGGKWRYTGETDA